LLLQVKGLKKYFPLQKGIIENLITKQKAYVHAVDDVSFTLKKGEIFGLVGESGSGKTTVGRLCVGLIEPTEGSIVFDGVDIATLDKLKLRQLRQHIQIIFQDPTAALNPRMRVSDAIGRPLKIYGSYTKQEIRQAVFDALDSVALSPPHAFYSRFPFELSGGQRQRVVIARSLVLNPKFIVADEPLAMVDVSVRAQIIDIIERMRKEKGMTFLFITHDLASAKYLCDRVAIMYAGQILEIATKQALFGNPQHPYTRALLSAVPVPDPKYQSKKMIVGGEVPSLVNQPSGCRFHPRCPYVQDVCRTTAQVLESVGDDHLVACMIKPFR